MNQLDLFADYSANRRAINKASLKRAPIATKEEVLKVQTAMMFDERIKPMDRIKAAELICKIAGYLDNQQQDNTVKVIVERVNEDII